MPDQPVSSEAREALLRVFGVPPMLMGERPEPPPDPRCRCGHWGCRIGYWHCHGVMGACFVPVPREPFDD